jgi:hypothetical protein
VHDAPLADYAKTLIDLQLLEMLMAETSLDETREACVAVFDARAQHPWPPAVIALPHWPPIYSRALEGLEHLELAETVQPAAKRVQLFVDRINAAKDPVTKSAGARF